MTSEIKVATLTFGFVGALIGSYILSRYLEDRNERLLKEEQINANLEKARIEGSYPPEYWTAKAAEAEAKAKTEQARIESEERLKMDERDRAEAEAERIRQFEKDAPQEYWDQKRIEEEEKTKRELNKQRFEAEQEAIKQHAQSLEEAAKRAEKALKRSLNYYDYHTPYSPWSITA